MIWIATGLNGKTVEALWEECYDKATLSEVINEWRERGLIVSREEKTATSPVLNF